MEKDAFHLEKEYSAESYIEELSKLSTPSSSLDIDRILYMLTYVEEFLDNALRHGKREEVYCQLVVKATEKLNERQNQEHATAEQTETISMFKERFKWIDRSFNERNRVRLRPNLRAEQEVTMIRHLQEQVREVTPEFDG
jgi:hypothetical protein